MNLWVRVAVLAVLLVLVAATGAAHAALGKLNKGRLRFLAAEGLARARSLLALVEEDSSVEPTLAAGNAAALALSAAVVTQLVADYLGGSAGASYSAGGAGLLILLWVQIASRWAGSAHPEETLDALRLPLRAIHLLLTPVALPMSGLARLVIPGERNPAAAGTSASDEELRMIVEAVAEDGSLEENEKEMIHSIHQMGERTARETMVPRVDIVSVEASEPLRAVLAEIKARGHSRIPIYEDTIDNIVGIVYAKDLLRHMEAGSLEERARTLSRPPHFVPESKKIDELLHEMQKNQVHMAIVVDEYGGTAGLVTIEDLLEEIVGEIHDEYDVEEKTIEKVNDQEAIFDARVSIHDVNETLGISLADGEYDTVGGLAYDRLGKIPLVGDEIHLEGISLRVLLTAGKRIKKVRIRVESEAEAERNREGQE